MWTPGSQAVAVTIASKLEGRMGTQEVRESCLPL